jgi:hypothetical protein
MDIKASAIIPFDEKLRAIAIRSHTSRLVLKTLIRNFLSVRMTIFQNIGRLGEHSLCRNQNSSYDSPSLRRFTDATNFFSKVAISII